MFAQVVAQRVKNSLLRVGLPVIAFELIAGMTAVNEVLSVVAAPA